MFPTVHPPSRDNSLVWPHFLLTGLTPCTFPPPSLSTHRSNTLHVFSGTVRASRFCSTFSLAFTPYRAFHISRRVTMPRPKKSKNQAKQTPRRKSPTEIVPLVHADNLSDRELDTPPQEPRHRTASPVGHSPTISTPDENLQARLGRLEKVFDEVSELKKHILEFTAVIPPAAGTCEHSSRQHGHDNAHEQPRVDCHGPPATPPHITLAGMSGAERRTEWITSPIPAKFERILPHVPTYHIMPTMHCQSSRPRWVKVTTQLMTVVYVGKFLDPSCM